MMRLRQRSVTKRGGNGHAPRCRTSRTFPSQTTNAPAAIPVSSGQLVGDSCATSRTNCCLNIADEFGTWKANGPVKPTLGAVCGEPCLEFCEPGAQPI